MSQITFRSGNVSIAMDDGLQRMVERVLADNHAHVLRAMEAEAGMVEARIASVWPVETGQSRAAFSTRMELSAGRVARRIGNSVDYVRYVKGRKQGGKSSFREVVILPALARAVEFARRAADELAEVHRG